MLAILGLHAFVSLLLSMRGKEQVCARLWDGEATFRYLQWPKVRVQCLPSVNHMAGESCI